jgi:translation initiation factor 1
MVDKQRVVYSTGQGRTCPECARAIADCRCKRSRPARTSPPAGDGFVRLSRETKGRKGKGVTLITGVPAADEVALEDLAKRFKRLCGGGGTLRDGVIEIQGDHRDRLMAELQKLGYKVKRAGG